MWFVGKQLVEQSNFGLTSNGEKFIKKNKEKKMNLKKELGGVADAVTKIMDEELKGNQHKIDANKNNKIDAHDFKLLRSKKKVEEEAEQIDEVSLKTATSAYVKRMGPGSDEKDPYGHKAIKTMSHIANRYGVKGVAKTAKAADDEYGIHDSEHNPRKDYVKMIMRDAKPFKKNEVKKEEVEQIDEYKSTGGVYKHKGTYGTEKSLEAGYTDYDKENELAKKNLKTKKPKKYGARQNFVRSTRVNESFTSILASYKENGLKGIAEMFATEQASQEEYEKEIEKAKAKSQGKDKAEVAKAAVQAVEVQKEQTHTKIEVVDMTDPYNIQKRELDLEESSDDYEVKQDKKDPDVHHVHYKGKKIGYVYGNKKGMFGHEYHAMGTGDDGYSSKKQAVNAVKADHKYHMSGDYLKERTLTEPEMKKKEEIVKSMKKGISGFKERYGSRAKNVMYATATKRAMGEEVEQIEEGTPEGYQRRDGKLIPKIHPKMTPHEHGYDYTMQTIEDAQSKAEVHRHHRAIQSDNPHPQGSQDNKDWTAGTDKAKADHLKDFS
jgi:hypothetical protein